jgi:molybdate transport system substrate-binding protein
MINVNTGAPLQTKIIFTVLLCCMFFATFAQPVRVAVAANASFVLKKLAADYKKKTGVSIEVLSGSSGKLATQIKNGAPYHIFLSADMDFTEQLYEAGFALTKPKVYAMGSLIVGSSTMASLKNWKQLLSRNTGGKIAIANPELAPYGKAAQQALKKLNLYQTAISRLVFAESISQVNTYVLNKAVDLGFTTESLVYELPTATPFKWERIDAGSYSPIRQGAVLLKYAKSSNYANARKFYDYLFSAAAKNTFIHFGYKTI